MSSLLDLIKQYGDERARWEEYKAINLVPEALALVEERIDRIRELLDKLATIDPQCRCTECDWSRTALTVLTRCMK